MAENDVYLGQVHLLSIGLHPGFYEYDHTKYELQLLTDIKALRPTRNKSAHKGNFGHALLVGGQVGKMGAMVLAAKGALRSGLGLLSCQVPAVGLNILQTSVPEAMCSVDNRQECISQLPKDLSLFQSIGIGPGMGTKDETFAVMNEVLSSFTKPIVIDADALNALAMHPALLNKVPAGSVLTPHPKEFARLFGESANDFERLQKAIDKATRHQVYIVLKGHHTQIACPEGNLFFNGSGNPGMATGGMGDVLTGVITGLLAQQIPVQNAVRLGVYLHGLAGNLAAQAVSEPALLPSDLIDHLGAAWLALD
jgi:NAD(P)H-hydrate epimerase